MSLIYSMLMSVDGYVEDEHGRFGFAQSDEEVHSYINQAGGPSFHVPFFFPALMLRVPRPCVLRKGDYDAADRVGSNGSVESIEPRTYAKDGAPIIAVASGIQSLGDPPRIPSAPSGFDQRPQQNRIAPAASPPALCKKRKHGATAVGMAHAKIV